MANSPERYTGNFYTPENPNVIGEQETFGSDTLHKIDRAREECSQRKSTENTVRSALNKSRKYFIDLVDREDLHPEINRFLYNSATRKAPEEITRDTVRPFINSLSDFDFEQMLRLHQEQFRKRKEELFELIPEWKQEFFSQVDTMRRGGDLDVDLGAVETRLHAIDVEFQDPLVNPRKYVTAFYDVYKHQVVMMDKDIKSKEEQQHIFSHELIHGTVAGRDYRDIVKESVRMMHLWRFGLSFSSQYASELIVDADKNREFIWLDEAVVESMNMKLSGSDYQIYLQERDLLNAFIEESEGRLTYTDFFNAFAQQARSRRQGRKFDEHFNNLFNKTSLIFSPNFLFDLNGFIKNQGSSLSADEQTKPSADVQRAVEVMRNDWKQFIGYGKTR